MNNMFVFNFNNQGRIRIIVTKNEDIKFVLDDICKVLNLSDVDSIVQSINEYEKDMCRVRTLFGYKKMYLISEIGLWNLVYHYKESSVDDICEWLTFKVKPVIKGFRKHSNLRTEIALMCLKIFGKLKHQIHHD